MSQVTTPPRIKTNINKGIGSRPNLLIHRSHVEPHFIPLYSQEKGLTVTLTDRWKDEVGRTIPDSLVFFEILKGTGNMRNSLGKVSTLKINTPIEIPFITERAVSLSFEFFAIDSSAKKIWTSFKKSIKCDLSDNQKYRDEKGWIDIRMDENMQVPYFYDHLLDADVPLVTISKTTDAMMESSKAFAILMNYSFFLLVMGAYISDFKATADSDLPEWFFEIMSNLNELDNILESNEHNEEIRQIIEGTEKDDLMSWLNRVAETLFLSHDADELLDRFLEDRFEGE